MFSGTQGPHILGNDELVEGTVLDGRAIGLAIFAASMEMQVWVQNRGHRSSRLSPCTKVDQPWDAFAYQGALETAWGCGSRVYTLQGPLDRGRGCSHSCGPVPHNPSLHFWCVELYRDVHVDKCTGNPTSQFLVSLLGK